MQVSAVSSRAPGLQEGGATPETQTPHAAPGAFGQMLERLRCANEAPEEDSSAEATETKPAAETAAAEEMNEDEAQPAEEATDATAQAAAASLQAAVSGVTAPAEAAVAMVARVIASEAVSEVEGGDANVDPAPPAAASRAAPVQGSNPAANASVAAAAGALGEILDGVETTAQGSTALASAAAVEKSLSSEQAIKAALPADETLSSEARKEITPSVKAPGQDTSAASSGNAWTPRINDQIASPTLGASLDKTLVLPGHATLRTLTEFTVSGIRYLVTNDAHTLTVRLVPESLGELHLQVTSTDNGMHVRLVSANASVRETLGNELGVLRATLTKEGLGAVRVDIASGMSSNPWPNGAPHQSAQDWAASQQRNAAPFASLEPTDWQDAPKRPAYHGEPHRGALNLFV